MIANSSATASARSYLRFALLATLATTAAVADAQERQYLGRDGTPLPFGNDAEIIAALSEGEIVESEVLGTGTTGVERLVIEYNGTRIRAAFRHVDEFEQNLRTPDGAAFARFYDRYASECAAYELGRLLDLDMIPPAALRRVDGRHGSVQLWVEDAMTEGERAQQGLTPPQAAAWRRQQGIMRVFDALVANSDRNTGNSLIDADWNLWMIDHSRTFQIPRGNDNPFARVTQLPGFLWDAIQRLDEDSVREALRDYLESPQITALWKRREGLIAHVEELIAVRGRDAVIIP